MALAAGTKLGPYEIQSPLGAGGMGEVYRARDTRLDRTVAVKILPTRLSDSPEAKQRFEREARAISSLSHPNICHLYDVGSQDRIDYLVMEYLEGETLARRVERGPLPTEQALRVATEISDALEKAHRQGVIHRDLKPGNIMLTKSGAKLMDFGLAKGTMPPPVMDPTALTAMTNGQPLTVEGTIVGTLQYMSPEQLQGREADARSDIFAFGAVLYEMITGKRAFPGKSHSSVMSAILEKDPEAITAGQPLAPPALEHVIRTCLAKDPDERFQTAHDVKLQLKWIAAGAPQLAMPAMRSNRERGIWIFAVVTLLVAMAAVYFHTSSERTQTTWSSILAPENTRFAYFAGPVTVSHDGRKLAFVATTSAGQDVVWVRPLGALNAQALPGTEAASFPFWSGDDRSIGFFARGKLKTIEAAGGPVVTICDAPGARGGTWNQSGVILFAGTWGGIYRVPSSGGTPSEITKLDRSHGELTHRWPFFLPDGRHFFYLAANFMSGNKEANSVSLGSLDSTETKLLFHARSNAAYTSGYVLYVRDRTLMAQGFDAKQLELRGQPLPIAGQVQFDELTGRGVFSGAANGTLAYQGENTGANSRMVMFDRAGKEVKTIGTPADFVHHKISPDGQRLAVTVLDPSVVNYKLWLYDLFREKETRLTFGPDRITNPVWAPEGNTLVFGSNKRGPSDIFEKRADSAGSEELVLQSDANKYPTDWSADGRFIAYSVSVGKSKIEVWILPRFGERKPYIFLQGDFNMGEGRFSPDGRWLAYTSDESGRAEVYVTPFPSGASKWQVSVAGGTNPRWRRDGKELFYLAADSELTAAQVDTAGSVFQVGAVRPLFHMLLRTGPSRLELSPTSGQIGYDAAPDGKWFVVNSPLAGSPPPITLVTNWAAELKKQ
ncbi:MAG TPA: protein kinase [Candidatus Acidoferrum sp.]|nr:protein kinase [Candidatus Acidoferrum sp.]